jgi:hypothetical protein
MDRMRWWIVAGMVLAAIGCAGTAEDAGGAPTSGSAEVVARVGEHEITLEEVDRQARQTDVQAYQALYEARQKALETMLTDRLLDDEAAERGITREQLLDQEVNQKTARPTAEQIQSFYEQNQSRMGGRSLEEMSAQISSFLVNQNRQQAMRTLLVALRGKSTVEVTLEPPRVPVTVAANDPTKGPAGAPVQILEFSDFQ